MRHRAHLADALSLGNGASGVAGSFGALPAALLAAYGARGDRPLFVISTVVAVVFFCCVIARLRRYTVDALGHASEERTSFAGVPSPVAAMSVSAAILAAVTGPPLLTWMPILFAAIASPLMMSRVRYITTPRLAAWLVRAKWPLPILAAVAYVAGSVAVALSVFFAAYFVSGPLSRRTLAPRA